MFKKTIATFIFILTSFYSFASFAQSEMQQANIALIDLKRVETESIAWKSLSQQISDRRATLKTEIQSMQTTLEEKANALEGQRVLLSAEAFAIEVESFKKERAALDQAARTSKQNLDKAFLEARNQIRTALNKVMITVVQEKNINLVLKAGDAESTVYFATKPLFINDIVLELLNKEITTVTLPSEASAQ